MKMSLKTAMKTPSGKNGLQNRFWLGAVICLLAGAARSHADSVCASVKIEIQQEVTLERHAMRPHAGAWERSTRLLPAGVSTFHSIQRPGASGAR